jgi:hypothetical protein
MSSLKRSSLSGYTRTVVDRGLMHKLTGKMSALGGVNCPPTHCGNYIGLLVILAEAVFAHDSIL